MKVFFLVAALVIGFIPNYGQENTPATPSNNNNQQAAAARERRIEAEQIRNQQNEFLRLKSLSPREVSLTAVVKHRRNEIAGLYRKPTKEEYKTLSPDPVDLTKFARFLNKKNTGILKLLPKLVCAKNAMVIVASPECTKLKFPGAGSSYSFRFRNYRIPRLADVTLDNGILIAKGALVDVVLVQLGNGAIETIDLNTKGMRFLREFKPVTDPQKAYDRAGVLVKGVENGGFRYGRSIMVTPETTYALRSIAYRGRNMKSVRGVFYNELGFDKRRDVLVVFRVVRKDEDGSITIVWKELQNQRAPKMALVK